MSPSVILYERPHAKAIWLELDRFESAAEAERIVRRAARPGEYRTGPVGARTPLPGSRALFTIARPQSAKRRSHTATDQFEKIHRILRSR